MALEVAATTYNFNSDWKRCFNMISNTAEVCPYRHRFTESPQDREANPRYKTKERQQASEKKKKIHNQLAPCLRTFQKPATEKLASDSIIIF